MGVSGTRDHAGRDRGPLTRWRKPPLSGTHDHAERVHGRNARWRKPPLAQGIIALLLLAAAPGPSNPSAWTRPIAPFHVIGPIDYVGTQGLAAYLIHTRAGAIVLDATLAANVPAIERSVGAEGVALLNVRLLLNSHAHFDHAAGLAQLKRDTGARLAAGAEDADALETGVPPGETDYGVVRFPPVPVDQRVPDGGTVRLGEVALTRIATPGHTPGDSSWALRVTGPGGRPPNVLFLGSLTVAGNVLVGNRRYPGIVADFRRSFARLAGVHADVVLTAHPETADVLGRHVRGDTFVDPALLPRLVAEARTAFEAELARQERGR